MKPILLVALLGLLCSLSLSAQMRQYEYDRAGNRISRRVMVLRSLFHESDSLTWQQEQMEREGIAQSFSDCKVTAFPNPTHGEVFLTITDGDPDARAQVTVHTQGGQLLITLQAQGNTTLPVDLTPYSPGIYLINFQQGENRTYYKIIKH